MIELIFSHGDARVKLIIPTKGREPGCVYFLLQCLHQSVLHISTEDDITDNMAYQMKSPYLKYTLEIMPEG